MHKLLIVRISALLCVLISMAMLIGLLAAAWFNEHQAFWGFFKSITLLFIPAAILVRATKNIPKSTLNTKDGFIVVFLAWLVVIACSAVPFFLSYTASVPDAFFEASSGITTTGASIFSDVESLPKSILLWRSLTHWIGGMGIVMLSIALMPLLGIGNMQLFRAEGGGLDKERLTPRIAGTAKILWIIYLAITLVSFSLYLYFGMGVFDAANHAMSAIASGGFSTKNTSIGYYQSPNLEWVSIGSMFAAGVSFALYFRLFTGKIGHILKNSELKAYIGLILFSAAILTTVNFTRDVYYDLGDSFREALFQAVSVITTTGFSTADYAVWHYLCQFAIFLLMFVGGCAGSTAGGFKVMRIVILCKNAINEMRSLLHPRGVFTLRMNGQVVGHKMVVGVSGFFFLYVVSILAVTGVASSANVDMVTAFSTSFALLGNIGAGLGAVGPLGSYGIYPDYVKWVLSLAMIVGRLEIYTFFMLLMPFFWRK